MYPLFIMVFPVTKFIQPLYILLIFSCFRRTARRDQMTSILGHLEDDHKKLQVLKFIEMILFDFYCRKSALFYWFSLDWYRGFSVALQPNDRFNPSCVINSSSSYLILFNFRPDLRQEMTAQSWWNQFLMLNLNLTD